MILEFKVSREILKKRQPPVVVDQSSAYYKCKFFIDVNVWRGSMLYATFMNDLGYIDTVPLGLCTDVISCLVPERIAKGGYFSLYISSDNNYKTNTISVTLTNHYKKAQPKCNIISEVFAHIDTKIDDLIYDNYQIKCYSNGELIDVIYLGNVDETLVKQWAEESFAELKGSFANVAFSGSYNDLVDVPQSFTPSPHTHSTDDVTDIETLTNNNAEDLLSLLTDEINNT